jgi:hypothetical protein
MSVIMCCDVLCLPRTMLPDRCFPPHVPNKPVSFKRSEIIQTRLRLRFGHFKASKHGLRCVASNDSRTGWGAEML